jgi:hypothetical protein
LAIKEKIKHFRQKLVLYKVPRSILKGIVNSEEEDFSALVNTKLGRKTVLAERVEE